MNILIINPIVYTSETKRIQKADSIKDTMIYDLCLAFQELGHRVTLYAGEPFRPTQPEEYPFEVIWDACKFQKICMPHCFPYLAGLRKYLKAHREDLDLIITSEVFSVNSLNTVMLARDKTIVWHELAKHNAMMKQLPSRFWYNVVARLFMGKVKVVPRSVEARQFISHYCKNTQQTIIEHGVNLHKFVPSDKKETHFVVCSQLIPRKRIDGILKSFAAFRQTASEPYQLFIIGDGELRQELEQQTADLGLGENVAFTGKLRHGEMLPYLASAQALLVNTEKDNSMISIVESISVGTPVVTTEVPLNASYIKSEQLGIAKDGWNEADMVEVTENNARYAANCLRYRETLSTVSKAKQFIKITRGGVILLWIKLPFVSSEQENIRWLPQGRAA